MLTINAVHLCLINFEALHRCVSNVQYIMFAQPNFDLDIIAKQKDDSSFKRAFYGRVIVELNSPEY